MEQLEKLEAKVKAILEKNDSLVKENEALAASVHELEEANLCLEESLLTKTEHVSELASDKESTRVAIDKLVSSLDALGSAEQ